MNILFSFPGPQLHDYYVKRDVPALSVSSFPYSSAGKSMDVTIATNFI